MRKFFVVLLILIAVSILEGCGSQMQTPTADRQNPAMSPTMRRARAGNSTP